MKNLFLTLISILFLSHASFASFPINEIAKEETKNNHENLEITTIEAAPDMDWTAFNLCLFGGYLGLHRFYMGHNGIGALQLATLGGAGIWWISDLIRIVKGDLYKGPLDPQFPEIDWSMLVLAIPPMGLFGLHRFYRGDKKIGLWQLFTLGGLGIWWLIDVVKILTGKLYKK
tara:strand:- start:283 stop:801 length:519 start_codon:yes stop_codon:yes gene_type:complete